MTKGARPGAQAEKAVGNLSCGVLVSERGRYTKARVMTGGNQSTASSGWWVKPACLGTYLGREVPTYLGAQ